jgi:hypothetical protein
VVGCHDPTHPPRAFAEARGVDTAFKPHRITAGLYAVGMTGCHVTADEYPCARRVQVDVRSGLRIATQPCRTHGSLVVMSSSPRTPLSPPHDFGDCAVLAHDTGSAA